MEKFTGMIIYLKICMHIGVLHACMSVYHVCAVPMKAKRGCCIPLRLYLQTVVSCQVVAGN